MKVYLTELLDQCIEHYIQKGMPITSGNIYNASDRDKSPATIRNRLKILEEMGYLHQVHADSGGRVPTTRAYGEYITRNTGHTFTSDIILDLAQACSVVERIEKKLGISDGDLSLARTQKDSFSRTTNFRKLFADKNLQMSCMYAFIKEKENG